MVFLNNSHISGRDTNIENILLVKKPNLKKLGFFILRKIHIKKWFFPLSAGFKISFKDNIF